MNNDFMTFRLSDFLTADAADAFMLLMGCWLSDFRKMLRKLPLDGAAHWNFLITALYWFDLIAVVFEAIPG